MTPAEVQPRVIWRTAALAMVLLSACTLQSGGTAPPPTDAGRDAASADGGADANDGATEGDGQVPMPDAGPRMNGDEYLGDDVSETHCDAKDDDNDGAIDEGACACPVRTWKHHAYGFCQNEVTWGQAKNSCIQSGYHLATIADADENAWLATAAPPRGQEYGWWIGFRRNPKNPTYAWITGEPVTYTHWAPGEPNNNNFLIGAVEVELCAEFSYYKGTAVSGFWNDAPCEGSDGMLEQFVHRPFICEAEPAE